MDGRPLPIAVSALVRDGRILLIKRIRGSYSGLMGLPGGKIELGEHASDAAVREVLEESGIESEVRRFIGIVSEHEEEGGKVINHFLLFLFELEPKGAEIVEGSEGRPEWVDLKDMAKIRDRVIPSDFVIIDRMICGEGGGYYDCAMEKAGGSYLLRKFGRIG